MITGVLPLQVLFNLANQYAANEMFAEALNTYQVIVKNRMFSNAGQWMNVEPTLKNDDDDDDDDCFYIALSSVLKQTHCTRMWFYMSD